MIYPKSIIGNNSIIHSGTVIGCDGFGYATENDVNYKILQIGNVIIEDDVEIGSNCVIDRGTLGSTVIGKNTKLDNLVHIAHNVKIGKGCFLTAQTAVAGSSIIEDFVSFGGRASVSGHITVGKRAKLAAKSGVTKSLAGNQTYAGMPARKISEKNKVNISGKGNCTEKNYVWRASKASPDPIFWYFIHLIVFLKPLKSEQTF